MVEPIADARSLFAGVWGFPITPFDKDLKIDHRALDSIVDFQVHRQIPVIVALGAIAEIDSLTGTEWREALKTIVHAVDSRCPVIATLPTSFGEAVEAASIANELNVSGVLLTPPSTAPQSGIHDYVTGVSRSAQLPTFIYVRGTPWLGLELAEKLCESPLFVGIKDGVADVRAYRRLRQAYADRLVFAAAWEDRALMYAALGVDSYCPASASHDPVYARALYERLSSADLVDATRLLDAFAYPLTDLRGQRPGIDVSVVKAAMAVRGLPSGRVRPPSAGLTAEEQTQVEALLGALDLLYDADVTIDKMRVGAEA